jgi:hypothetical protein
LILILPALRKLLLLQLADLGGRCLGAIILCSDLPGDSG